MYFKGVTTNPPITVKLVTKADGSAFTGTPTMRIKKDGGAWAAATGTGPTQEESGHQEYAAADAEYVGAEVLHVAFNDTLAVGDGQTVSLVLHNPHNQYNGSIVIDSVGGTVGDEFGRNGTNGNPVTTLADALTLANLAGYKRIELLGDTDITLSAGTWDEWEFLMSPTASIDGNGQSCVDMSIVGGTLYGTFLGPLAVSNCALGNGTMGVTSTGTFKDCSLAQNDTSTVAAVTANGTTPSLVFSDCEAIMTAGLAASISLASIASASVRFTKISGNIDIADVGASSFLNIDGTGGSFRFNDIDPGAASVTAVVSGNMQQRGSTPSNWTATFDDEGLMNRSVVGQEATTALNTYNAPTSAEMDAAIDAQTTSLAADIADVKTQIGTAGAGLTAIPETDVNMVKISGSATAADNLEESAEAIITGSCTGTPTTTATDTTLTGYLTSELVGRTIIFKGGTADGQMAEITSFTQTNGVVGFATLTTAPAASDPFVIV